MGNVRTLGFHAVGASYQDVNAGQNPRTDWFSEMDYIPNPSDWVNNDLPVPHERWPAGEATPVCELSGPVGTFTDLTWSPGGTKLAWAEGNGIWSATVPPLFDSTACAGIVLNLLIRPARLPSGFQRYRLPADPGESCFA